MDAHGEKTLVRGIVFFFGLAVGVICGAIACGLAVDYSWRTSAVRAKAGRYISSPSGSTSWVWGEWKE